MKASLLYNNTVYFAHSSKLPATLNLIEGIYSKFQDQAFYLLRKRIYTDDTPSESIYGAVKVAAKSITFEAPSDFLSAHNTVQVSPGSLPAYDQNLLHKKLEHAEAVNMFLDELVSSRNQSEKKFLSDRPISAVLVSRDGSVLSYARSHSSLNKVFHAEYVLLKRLIEQGYRSIPEGAVLHTTLKPCKMCAGLIWDLSENKQNIDVRFREFDHGPYGRSTVLDLNSYERQRTQKLL